MDSKEDNLSEEEIIIKKVFIDADEFNTLVKDAGLINFQPSFYKSKILFTTFLTIFIVFWCFFSKISNFSN
jgi:hypothetical protein